jgi:hypothetical protein
LIFDEVLIATAEDGPETKACAVVDAMATTAKVVNLVEDFIVSGLNAKDTDQYGL